MNNSGGICPLLQWAKQSTWRISYPGITLCSLNHIRNITWAALVTTLWLLVTH